jgi:hypothetical protein
MSDLDLFNTKEGEQLTKYRKALEKISELGSVCDNFEICAHESCRDSAGAVLIALEALKDEMCESN